MNVTPQCLNPPQPHAFDRLNSEGHVYSLEAVHSAAEVQAAKNLTAIPSAAFNAISPELASAVIVKNLIGSNDTHAASVVIAGYLQANEEVITSAQFNTMTAEITRVNPSVALWLLRKAVHFDAAEACLETPSPSKRKSKGANSGGQTSHKRQRAESTPSSSSFSSSSSASPPDPDVSAQPASTLRERCITSLGDDFRAVFQPNPQARSSMPGDIPFEARIAILERALQLAYAEVDSTKKELASTTSRLQLANQETKTKLEVANLRLAFRASLMATTLS